MSQVTMAGPTLPATSQTSTPAGRRARRLAPSGTGPRSIVGIICTSVRIRRPSPDELATEVRSLTIRQQSWTTSVCTVMRRATSISILALLLATPAAIAGTNGHQHHGHHGGGYSCSNASLCQYVENVPGAGGANPASPGGGGGGGGHNGGGGGHSAISPETQQALAGQGAD